MGLRDMMFSRGQDRKEEPRELQPEGLPVQAEGQKAGADETPAPPQGRLELPPEHPLELLWSLWAQGCEEEPPRPALRLEEVLPAPGAPHIPLLTAADAVRELPRLEEQMTAAALERLTIHKPGEDGASPDLDAAVQVFLTAGAMTAWLLVFPPSGSGAGVSRELLEDALSEAQVRFGVEEELLSSLPNSPERYFHLYLAARGVPPVHGKDGSVIDLFSREPKRTFVEDDTGRVDYASFDLFQNVKKDDVICRILPPVPGEDGRSVLNEAVPARQGKAVQAPRGQNTLLTEDRGSLISACDGHLEFNKKCFQVKPVLDIWNNVDFSTGNINCNGDVHVRGDVRSGFTIQTTGNITVDGVVEGGSLTAGGDLIVRKGVQGNGKAVLRAGRGIYARYLESCCVYVRKVLEAESVVNSEVYCDGAVRIRSGRGSIIGGKTHAGREISAKSVGTPAEPQTLVFLGGRPCEQSEREGLAREIESLTKELEKIERQPDSPAKLRRMSKTRVRISADRMKLDQMDRDLEGLTEEEREARGRLECDVIYPGVEIAMGVYCLRVAHETRKCMTTVSKGDLTLIAAK